MPIAPERAKAMAMLESVTVSEGLPMIGLSPVDGREVMNINESTGSGSATTQYNGSWELWPKRLQPDRDSSHLDV